jgi:hypothetical protein
MARLFQINKLLFVLLVVGLNAEAFQVDFEGSLQHTHTEYAKNKTAFEKASIAVKKVLSDEKRR